MPRVGIVGGNVRPCLEAWRILATTFPLPLRWDDPVDKYMTILRIVKEYAAIIAKKGIVSEGIERERLMASLVEAWVVEQSLRLERECRRGARRCVEGLSRYLGGVEPLLEPFACEAAVEAARLLLRVYGLRSHPGSMLVRAWLWARSTGVAVASKLRWCAGLAAGMLACPLGMDRSRRAMDRAMMMVLRVASQPVWPAMKKQYSEDLRRLRNLAVAAIFRVILATPRGVMVAPRRSVLAQAVLNLLRYPRLACKNVTNSIQGEDEYESEPPASGYDGDGGYIDDDDDEMSPEERERMRRALEEIMLKIAEGADPDELAETPIVYRLTRTPMLGESILLCADKGIEIIVYGPGFTTNPNILEIGSLANAAEAVLKTPPIAIAWWSLTRPEKGAEVG